MADEIIGYKLTPVHSGRGGIATAALLQCAVTGATLATSGGGSQAISPEVFGVLTKDPEVQALIKQKIEAARIA